MSPELAHTVGSPAAVRWSTVHSEQRIRHSALKAGEPAPVSGPVKLAPALNEDQLRSGRYTEVISSSGGVPALLPRFLHDNPPAILIRDSDSPRTIRMCGKNRKSARSVFRAEVLSGAHERLCVLLLVTRVMEFRSIKHQRFGHSPQIPPGGGIVMSRLRNPRRKTWSSSSGPCRLR